MSQCPLTITPARFDTFLTGGEEAIRVRVNQIANHHNIQAVQFDASVMPRADVSEVARVTYSVTGDFCRKVKQILQRHGPY